jgi:phospholipid/cholesterol/gamma-HCH transport system ATP-binding protein
MIRFDDVWLSFGETEVLKGVDMHAAEGTTTALVGRSGSGKSTMMRLIIGFLRADHGRIIIDGQDVTGLKENEWVPVRRKMGLVFQNSALFDSLSVAQNVGFYPHFVERKPWREVFPDVMDLLEDVGLAGHGEKIPSELSGGMQRRAALARSLIYRPKILLYDEPTTGLDPYMIEVVNELILEMNDKYGVTSVVVTHDLECVNRVADNVVLLVHGDTTEVGHPSKLLTSDEKVVVEFTQNWRKSLEAYAYEIYCPPGTMSPPESAQEET